MPTLAIKKYRPRLFGFSVFEAQLTATLLKLQLTQAQGGGRGCSFEGSTTISKNSCQLAYLYLFIQSCSPIKETPIKRPKFGLLVLINFNIFFHVALIGLGLPTQWQFIILNIFVRYRPRLVGFFLQNIQLVFQNEGPSVKPTLKCKSILACYFSTKNPLKNIYITI